MVDGALSWKAALEVEDPPRGRYFGARLTQELGIVEDRAPARQKGSERTEECERNGPGNARSFGAQRLAREDEPPGNGDVSQVGRERDALERRTLFGSNPTKAV